MTAKNTSRKNTMRFISLLILSNLILVHSFTTHHGAKPPALKIIIPAQGIGALHFSKMKTTNTGFSFVSTRNPSQQSTSLSERPLGTPGTAKLDKPWDELGFEFRATKSNLRISYKDGKWGELELCEDPTINLHMGATALLRSSLL